MKEEEKYIFQIVLLVWDSKSSGKT